MKNEVLPIQLSSLQTVAMCCFAVYCATAFTADINSHVKIQVTCGEAFCDTVSDDVDD